MSSWGVQEAVPVPGSLANLKFYMAGSRKRLCGSRCCTGHHIFLDCVQSFVVAGELLADMYDGTR
eukprot:357285-Chlamydomonas_euryale.AAC.1